MIHESAAESCNHQVIAAPRNTYAHVNPVAQLAVISFKGVYLLCEKYIGGACGHRGRQGLSLCAGRRGPYMLFSLDAMYSV